MNFTERARFKNSVDATEAQLLPYFHAVESARVQSPEVSLTYYEFTLLAIVCWFDAQQPDAVVLEVGLGGRLDATSNDFDSEVAIVTLVDIDHVGFGRYARSGSLKAGIFRTGKTAICA